MSFQVSPVQALENAGKLLKDGAFESVKLEGGEEVAEHVRRIVSAGIPVMGHVGLTPQSVHAMGGFKVQAKSEEAAARVIEGARAIWVAHRQQDGIVTTPTSSAGPAASECSVGRVASAMLRD